MTTDVSSDARYDLDFDPLISVLLVVKDGGKDFGEALDSILSQTYKNIELIVIDDASTDNSAQIFKNHAVTKVFSSKYVKNETTFGLTKSLNVGLGLSNGSYVARIDHDDIWLPKKLELQVARLQADPELILLGTHYEEFVNDTDVRAPAKFSAVTSDHEIREVMYLRNPFLHSSVLISKRALHKLGGYHEGYLVAQDYELWTRLLMAGRGCIIDEVLVLRRVRPSNISVRRERAQRLNAFRVKINWVRKNGFRGAVMPALIRDVFVILMPSAVKKYVRSR